MTRHDLPRDIVLTAPDATDAVPAATADAAGQAGQGYGSSDIDAKMARRAVAGTVLGSVAGRLRPSQILGEEGGSSLLGTTMDGFWGLGQQAALGLIVEGKAPDARQMRQGAVQILAASANQQVARLASDAAEYGEDHGIRFLRNLEVRAQWFPGERPSLEARTVDALFQSAALEHTLFAQAEVRTDFSETTLNAGLGYRYQLPDSDWMLGVNAFYDQQFEIGHQRMSIGLEASTSDFTLFANRYIALSGWAESSPDYEERPLSGWDVGIAGQLPGVDALYLSLSAFRWEQQTEQDKTGFKLMADYALPDGIQLGGTFAADDAGDIAAGVRLTYQFGAEAFGGTDLADGPQRDRRLAFVNRENVIITEEREIPKDYTVAFLAGGVTTANETALAFELANAPLQASYVYRITSSAGGSPVTGSGIVTGRPLQITGVDVSGLADGTLTLTITVISQQGATGPDVTDSIEKSTATLAASTATTAQSPTNLSPIPFTITFSQAVNGFAAADLGLTNGTAANLRSDDNITWTVDVTPLQQGAVALEVPAGITTALASGKPNAASNRTSVSFDNEGPSGYAVAFLPSPITATDFEITGAEPGATFRFTISSTGGGTEVTGEGTITTAPQLVTGLDLSGLGNGTLTLSLTLTDPLGNAGSPATDSFAKTDDPPLVIAVITPQSGTYDDL